MSFVWLGIGFMAFFGASTLAIDVGMYMTARSQAQNAADGGALAGATALVFDDYDDRSAGGPAVNSAITTAEANPVMGAIVDVDPSDVTFPLGPTGLNNRVRVNVFRTTERENAVSTLTGRVFGIDTVDIIAAATAEASPASAVECAKPFTIPDRWKENSIPPNGTFERYDNRGNLLENADEYFPPGTPQHEMYGYSDRLPPSGDRGLEVLLRPGNANKIEPSFYFSWVMPGCPGGGIGGSCYRENIAKCNRTRMSHGVDITQEPGDKVGETNQGYDDLFAQDPNAHYDETLHKVVSDYNPSPRVFPIPLFDPDHYQNNITHGRNASLRIVEYLGFFLERRVGNNVYGRIVPYIGVNDPGLGPAPADSFPKSIRLVQ
jgi:hypothetical protein